MPHRLLAVLRRCDLDPISDWSFIEITRIHRICSESELPFLAQALSVLRQSRSQLVRHAAYSCLRQCAVRSVHAFVNVALYCPAATAARPVRAASYCEQVQEYTSLLALSLLEREHECIGTPSHAWHRYELTAVGR